MPSGLPFAAPSLPPKGDHGSYTSYYGITWDKMGVNGISWEIPTELSTDLHRSMPKLKANQCLALKEKLKNEKQDWEIFFHIALTMR